MLVVLVGLAVAAFYWLLQHQSVQITAETDPPNSARGEASSNNFEELSNDSRNAEPDAETSSSGCLTAEMLEAHPMFAGEEARLDTIAVTGPTIASYRGLKASSLEGLAAQGDTAAMAVLGAISMLKARGIEEQHAVPFLLFENLSLHSYREPPLDDPEVRQHYKDAQEWFYKAALRGRLFALYWVGEMKARLEGGAVRLGWIEEAEHAELSALEQSALMPPSVYNLLAFEVAPQLRTGLIDMYYESLPKHEYQEGILKDLVDQFERDRKAAYLPPIVVPESTSPPWTEVEEMLCQAAGDRSD